MTDDYKNDADKPPLLDALLPFYPALMALAAMMEDMKHKHRLAGAMDPFNEWRKLPQAKKRLANGNMRHMLAGPWTPNVEDAVPGRKPHLHATHALFGLLASLTIHQEDNAQACCGAADAATWPTLHQEPLHGPAGADWRASRREPGNPDLPILPRCQASMGGHQCVRPAKHQGQLELGENL